MTESTPAHALAALAIADMLPGARVLECTLAKRGLRADSYTATIAIDGSPQPCIAKHFRQNDEFAARECASYRLFADRAVGVAPVMLAAANDNTWLVIEALPGLDLIAALRAGAAHERLMSQLASTLAQLAITTGVQNWGQTQGQTPLNTPTSLLAPAIRRTSDQEADALARNWPRVAAWANGLGVSTDTAVDAVVGDVIERYRTPRVVAWTQGDPAPSNVLFDDNAAVLVDFEYGAFRHALHDLAQWRVRCPLPPAWCTHLEQAVGAALVGASVYPNVATFEDDLAAMTAYAALYMFTWLPIAEALTKDAPWAPNFPVRAALLSTAHWLGHVLGARHPALRRWSHELERVLAARWPEHGTGAIDWARV